MLRQIKANKCERNYQNKICRVHSYLRKERGVSWCEKNIEDLFGKPENATQKGAKFR